MQDTTVHLPALPGNPRLQKKKKKKQEKNKQKKPHLLLQLLFVPTQLLCTEQDWEVLQNLSPSSLQKRRFPRT